MHIKIQQVYGHFNFEKEFVKDQTKEPEPVGEEQLDKEIADEKDMMSKIKKAANFIAKRNKLSLGIASSGMTPMEPTSITERILIA